MQLPPPHTLHINAHSLSACSGIKREHLFITTKLHPRHHGYWTTLEARCAALWHATLCCAALVVTCCAVLCCAVLCCAALSLQLALLHGLEACRLTVPSCPAVHPALRLRLTVSSLR